MNKTNAAKDILRYLEGKWGLSREINGSHSALAKGVAFFSPTTMPNELHYVEEVEILLANGSSLNGYQNYIYRCENEIINVYFHDGNRLFHSMNIQLDDSHRYITSHHCQLDTYHTSYFFVDNYFEIEHRVKGPKKDYISHTMYTRYF